MKIAILQPMVPHYRQEFFEKLNDFYEVDLYVYQHKNAASNVNMQNANISTKLIWSINIGSILIYDIRPFLNQKYKVLVLMGTITHLSTWFLLFFRKLFGKKIVLWGHGISIKRYLKQEKKLSLLYKLMHKMADSAWFYTEKERIIWNLQLPQLKSVSLNNTISGVGQILNLYLKESRDGLKKKYSIRTPVNLIFCARFSSQHRRIDVLEKLIQQLDSKKYGFIIIGDGLQKPDFSGYQNVYDFGAVYEKEIKYELFNIADMYIQPGWLGLSVIESMAFGKPVFALKRTQNVFQCVEYGHVKSEFNGYIASSTKDLLNRIENSSKEELRQLGMNAREYVRDNLMMTQMVDRAVQNIRGLRFEN